MNFFHRCPSIKNDTTSQRWPSIHHIISQSQNFNHPIRQNNNLKYPINQNYTHNHLMRLWLRTHRQKMLHMSRQTRTTCIQWHKSRNPYHHNKEDALLAIGNKWYFMTITKLPLVYWRPKGCSVFADINRQCARYACFLYCLSKYYTLYTCFCTIHFL